MKKQEHKYFVAYCKRIVYNLHIKFITLLAGGKRIFVRWILTTDIKQA